MAVSSKTALSFGQRLWSALSAWAIRNAGYQKYGLRREDLYIDEDPVVTEALRRLPQEETDVRLWRLKRALDLSMKKRILPKDQWTSEEEDKLYMTPYILEENHLRDLFYQPGEQKSLKMWHVYYACFSEVFGVSPDLSTQPSFMVDHPELLDDLAGKVQFFRLMRWFMECCAVHDFRLTDSVTPDSKRTCRNLSAIVNFIKFHVHMTNEGQEQEEAIGLQMNEYATAIHRNQELKQKLAALQRQKQEEQEHEEELRQIISQEEEHIQLNLQQEVALKHHLQGLNEQKEKEEQRKALPQNELDKICQRIDDLRKQRVTSPEKLRACLKKLHREIEETGTRDSDTLMRMWESLATKAQHIPNVQKGLNGDMELLIMKTNKDSDLQDHLETLEEQISRQKQALKETSAKHQNLVRHLKFVEEESQQMSYDDQKLSLTQFRSELERDVRQSQTQVHSVEMANEDYSRQIEELKNTLEAKRAEHKETCMEMKKIMTNLEFAVQGFVGKCNTTSNPTC